MFLVKCQADNAEGSDSFNPCWLAVPGVPCAIKVAPKAAADATVDAGNSTNSTAADGGNDVTATEAPIVAHLAQKRVTHLAQKVPTAHVVGHVQARGQAPRAASNAGMHSPLQVSCARVRSDVWSIWLQVPACCVPLCVSLSLFLALYLSLSISRSLSVRARVRGA